jgi:type VI secretion system secreted protein VgrG
MAKVMPRVMEIVTPLGEDAVLFHAMRAREEMNRPFEYHIDLLGDPDKPDVNLDEILGKNVTLKLGLPDDEIRFFNGHVTRFVAGGMHGRYRRYLATVRPWLWFLTRTADCRIFQELTVPDIIKSVFADHGVADFKFELTSTYRKWTYCVQYRETDFNFVSRLMEQEGIAYYFRHSEGHNTLVLTDTTTKHKPAKGCEALSFVSDVAQVKPDLEHISRWEITREIQPGVYVHDDYDLERPSVELKTSKTLPRKYQPSDYEIYDYPGEYLERDDGEQYAAVRIDELGTQFELATAATNARGLTVGSQLTLQDHPRADQNGDYLVVSASYDLTFEDYEALPAGGGTQYSCTFAAMPVAQQFRPNRQTPKPFVQGPQTAVVVGPGGEEIFTDKFGRVKVQFHWDRRGKKDDKSSCWIRVSHPWAGKGWGSVATPRIGQEVIVDFLEGDPDQPIITGRVYNAEQLPPFGFPAGAVLSGIKSQTHKGAGYNELSMDDTAGKERVFVHGQYNMDTVIEHDQTSTIHNCRTDRVDVDDSESIGNNQKWDVGVNRDCSIGSNETLTVGANRTKSIGANETISVGSNRDATIGASESLTVALQRTHTVGVNETISVGAAQEITIGGLQAVTVGANQSISVGGAQSMSVGGAQSMSVGAGQSMNIGADQGVSVGAGQAVSVKADRSMSVGGDEKYHVKGGRTTNVGKDDSVAVAKNYLLEAGDSITIKTGDASISMKKDGTIVIKGKDITIEGSGKINAKASGDMVMKASNIKQN